MEEALKISSLPEDFFSLFQNDFHGRFPSPVLNASSVKAVYNEGFAASLLIQSVSTLFNDNTASRGA